MMSILVTAASKYGATWEIAEVIAQTLSFQDFSVTILRIEDVEDVVPYDAVILGSAIYAGNWRRSAKEFIREHSEDLKDVPVWLFSSGPLGKVEPDSKQEVQKIAELIEATNAVEYKTFAGKINKHDLNFGERLVVKAVGAPDGDFRDWKDVTLWANQISATLHTYQDNYHYTPSK